MSDLLQPLPDSVGTRRKENTRARLIRASLEVFVEKGIDGATIDDLVTAAGYTRGAFYSNFSSKEEVFEALFTSVTDELVGIVTTSAEQALKGGTRSSDRVGDDETVMLEVFTAVRPFGRQWCLLHSDAMARAVRDGRIRSALVAERRRLRSAIAGALQAGLEQHGDRAVLPVEDLAQLFVAVFVDLLVREQTEDLDVESLGAVTIVRLLQAFIEPGQR